MNGPQRALEWVPVVVHYGGVAGILFTAVFWALTGRLEPLFLGTFGAMMGLGEAGKFVRDLFSPAGTDYGAGNQGLPEPVEQSAGDEGIRPPGRRRRRSRPPEPH